MIRKIEIAARWFAILLVGFSFVAAARAGNAPGNPLEDQLKAKYKLVRLGTGANGQIILEPGVVLVIQKAGMVGVSPTTAMLCPATFKDGSMHSPNAFCLGMVKNATRDLTIGEKVYVFKIEVNEKNDKISLRIVECDACNGVTEQSFYKSDIIFQFPKGYVATADAAKVSEVISNVLTVDAPEGDAKQAGNPGDQPAASPSAPPEPAPAPAPAADAPAQPIQVGQTIDQVQASTGNQLVLIADLGSKKIYRCQGLKIVFVDGKVTDVQ